MRPPKEIKAPQYVLATEGLTTQRQWRNLKRRQLKALIAVFEQYRLGCAYAPCNPDGAFDQVCNILRGWKQQHSQKAWGK